MLKNLVITIATIGFITACGKKSDDAPAAPPAPVAPAGQKPPGPKTDNSGVITDRASAPVGQVNQQGQGRAQQGQSQQGQSQIPGAGQLVLEDYSTAADDYAAQYLLAQFGKEKDLSKHAANLKRSQQILGAKLQQKNGSASLTVTLLTGGQPQKQGQKEKTDVVFMSGYMSEHGDAVLKGRGQMSATLKAVAELRCMDVSPSRKCNTTAVTVKFGERNKITTVMMLMRTSTANFDIAFPTEEIKDADYVNLVRLFKNTAVHIYTENSLKALRMDSVEVINGRADMTVTMISQDNDLFLMKFPLIRQIGDSMSVDVDKTISIEEATEIMNHAPFKAHIAESLSSITLVKNDGRGNLTFDLRMKALDQSATNTIKMTLKRKLNRVTF